MARIVTRVAVALGSNLGDRAAHLRAAVVALASVLDGLVVSSIIETDPVDTPDAQPPYLNAVAIGHTGLSPRDLLHALQVIELAHGRARPYRNAPRTLDLDLILYGDEVIDTATLQVPHPRFRERAFVLRPLAEVAGGWRDPVTRRTILDLLSELPG